MLSGSVLYKLLKPVTKFGSSSQATIGLKGRIVSYHLRKSVKKDDQVFGFSMIAISKIGSSAHAE